MELIKITLQIKLLHVPNTAQYLVLCMPGSFWTLYIHLLFLWFPSSVLGIKPRSCTCQSNSTPSPDSWCCFYWDRHHHYPFAEEEKSELNKYIAKGWVIQLKIILRKNPGARSKFKYVQYTSFSFNGNNWEPTR